MLKIFLLFCLLLINCRQAKRIDNICSTNHLKRVYLQLGESGVLTAYNITEKRNATFHEGCQMEIVTCPSCMVSLTFKHINLGCCCRNNLNFFLPEICRCDRVWVLEPPYDEASGTSFCGGQRSSVELLGGYLGYKSKTRIVRIYFFYTRPHSHAFTMEYKSEPNRHVFSGFCQRHPTSNNSNRVISSPFFPSAYPKDISVEYVIKCVLPFNYPSPKDYHCRVRLIFTDFLLALPSTLEFFDGDRQIDVISGSSFRPPVVISGGDSLTVRFSANEQSNLGFKASFSFVSENNIKDMAKVVTDCGGFVENSGGTITMMNMATTEEFKFYDCVWLIKPQNYFLSFKSHLYLKITTFVDFAGEAELEIRRGLTSESPLLEALRYPTSQRFKEHILPPKSGYYVRLKALFGPDSHLAIAYSAFSYNRCFVFSDFLCQNFRCISKRLKCDGFDHCGDDSDEPDICSEESALIPSISRWQSNTPNYYFPKMKEYSASHTASLLFLFSLVVMSFLASGMTVLLYRAGRARRERILQDQLETLSEIRDGLSDEIFVEVISVDDPPSYEPPPNYEDVMESSGNSRASRQTSSRQNGSLCFLKPEPDFHPHFPGKIHSQMNPKVVQLPQLNQFGQNSTTDSSVEYF